MRDNAAAMARLIPRGAALVEFGTGSAMKAHILLEAAPQIAAYVPVDICAEFLADEASSSSATSRALAFFRWRPTSPAISLPAPIRARPRVGFFPGSTIGNFEPHEATDFLRQAGEVLGRARPSSSAPIASRTKPC